MNPAMLVSIQVGLPRSYGREGADNPMDRPWETGFFKQPVDGPRWLGKTNLVGDGQADLVNHGGVGQGRALLRGVALPGLARGAPSSRICRTARSARTSPSKG